MMTDLNALVAAACRYPLDRLALGILADWLDEHEGDSIWVRWILSERPEPRGHARKKIAWNSQKQRRVAPPIAPTEFWWACFEDGLFRREWELPVGLFRRLDGEEQLRFIRLSTQRFERRVKIYRSEASAFEKLIRGAAHASAVSEV